MKAKADFIFLKFKPNLCLLIFTFLSLFLLASCAQPEKKEIELIWPQPPDEPRIKYLEKYSNNLDVEGESTFARALLGEEVKNELIKPYGVATDKDGRVYVTDIGKVFVFDKKNKKLSFIGDGPGAGKLRVPIGIAVSQQDGKVYVTDTAADVLYIYDSNGKFLKSLGNKGDFESPSGIAIDERRKRFYVVDAKKHNVRAYDFDWNLLFTIGKRGGAQGEFNLPTNITIDSSGNVYVVDTGNFRVQIFDPEGKYVKLLGEIGDRPGNFARPKGIAIDSEDHIYIIDAAFQNFQIFDQQNRLLLFVGEGGFNPGQFAVPAGMYIDNDDRVYVVDQLNVRVQVFQYLGEKWKSKQGAQQKTEGK